MKREKYTNKDFDFAVIFISDLNVFYVMPVNVFNSYAGTITLHEEVSKQRKPKSHAYREAWDLLERYIAG
jgi:ABC-type dipeptide/oligopeptide/nickel transport system ATPase component